MAQVSLKNVTKVFSDAIVALDRVSLNVADRELMVVVGPSGCGKTTLLRSIAGLERPDAGQIKISEKIVNNVPPKDRDVSMVFQNYALYPHLTVFQNMAFGLRFRKHAKSEIEKRVKEVAMMLEITNLLGRKPAALSGGQRQCVALGRAMAQRPKVFLFDEPLSNLDPQSRVSARRKIKSLHRRLNTTTVYVTHDQGEAMTLGDRLAVMCNGIIHQVGSPLEVFNAPANRFVASFIGTPQMNFLRGTIKVNERRTMFLTHDGEIPLPVGLSNRAKAANDQELILGIRPRDIHYEPVSSDEERHFLGRVEVIETPGDRLDVQFVTRSGTELTVSLDPSYRLNVGDLGRVTLDPSGVKIFRKGPFGPNIDFANVADHKD